MTYSIVNIETTSDACVLVASRSKRSSLREGMLARLIFQERNGTVSPRRRPQRERLWVKITKRTESTRGVIFEGELVTDTFIDELIDDLELGLPIVFGPEHITEWDVEIPSKTRPRARSV